ncbi:hypothetical protein [Vibrio phage vB_VpaM_XM1]
MDYELNGEQMMKKNRFYKTSCHGGVGSNVSFHAIKGQGYVTNIDEAEVYTLEEAQAAVDNCHIRDYPEQELFLSADHVDALSVWKVDCQYVNKKYPDHQDPNNEYVAYKKGTWDGNDLGFHTGFGFSYDYERAVIYPAEKIPMECIEDHFDYVFVPKSHTDEVARRTFQYKNINRRKMISCAGVIGIRRKRKRFSSGKVRFNCVVCGKIVWEFAHPDCDVTCSHFCDTTHKHHTYRKY